MINYISVRVDAVLWKQLGFRAVTLIRLITCLKRGALYLLSVLFLRSFDNHTCLRVAAEKAFRLDELDAEVDANACIRGTANGST